MSCARYGILALLSLMLLAIAADPAWAAKTAKALPEWRVIWNQAWKIINFLLLAFVVVKLARNPIKNFVSGQKASVAETIRAMEKAKAEAEAERQAIEARTAGLEKELEVIEAYLAEQAAREREAIVEDAQREARLILERAELMGERSLREARSQLANEMIDLAGQMAEETLLKAINEADRARFLDDFSRRLAEVDLAPQR